MKTIYQDQKHPSLKEWYSMNEQLMLLPYGHGHAKEDLDFGLWYSQYLARMIEIQVEAAIKYVVRTPVVDPKP